MDWNKDDNRIVFYGLGIKDANGYFSMNMELFASSTSKPVYLLGPDSEDEKAKKSHFVLLKVYPRIPDYQYYIRKVNTPDETLNSVLSRLVQYAKTDFDSLRVRKYDSTMSKRKGRDTFMLQAHKVYMQYHSNYTATLQFNASDDPSEFKKQWEYYQRIVQSFLGENYVYHYSDLGNDKWVFYYAQHGGDRQPRFHLRTTNEKGRKLISIVISSTASHPVKAGLDADDFLDF
jgi:hypothetical protein